MHKHSYTLDRLFQLLILTAQLGTPVTLLLHFLYTDIDIELIRAHYTTPVHAASAAHNSGGTVQSINQSIIIKVHHTIWY